MGSEADKGTRGISIDGKVENCGECAFLVGPYSSRAAHCGRTGSEIVNTKVCLKGRFIREPQSIEDIDELVRGLLQRRSLFLATNSQDMSPVTAKTLSR